MIYALIRNNLVLNLVVINDEQAVLQLERSFSWVIDVTNASPRPAIGWSYVDGVFAPPVLTLAQQKEIAKAKILGYQAAANAILVDLYATNALAGVTTSQVNEIFGLLEDVLLRMREGALPAALVLLATKSPSGALTQEMLDSLTSQISAAL